MANPTPITDPNYRQSVKNWLDELRGHDPDDIRGMLQGLSILMALVASRVEPHPTPSPICGSERFDMKIRLWRNTLADLQARG